jgi:phosphoribosyl-ATP pyrophosphohydrolase
MKSFDSLYNELISMGSEPDVTSGSNILLAKGVHEIGKKLVEEAAELWMAAEHESDDQVALEASQLLYYIQLILISRNVPMSAVEKVL